MMIENIRDFIKEKAEEFGARNDNEFNKAYVERNNTSQESLRDNGAYFGLIHPEEELSGPYHDFSIAIFPSDQGKPWLISLGVGSSGFKNDYELATYPGLRRLFSKFIDERGFCKSDFSDIETGLPKKITGNPDLLHIKNTIKTYTKFLPVCQIIDDPESERGKQIIAAFLAGYAKLRDWPTNKEHRKAVSDALAPFIVSENFDESIEIRKLLLERRYVILQGPPGTGKTRLAKKVANDLKAQQFFTQFHAETTYSDFIFGIRPDTSGEKLLYKNYYGCFVEAVKTALKEDHEKVVLIIDEINRANLSNVLGPIFYLFEHKMVDSQVEIQIAPGLTLKKLPKNFYVIATMNTADRSLAVVDFALRRRFAWYTKVPKVIEGVKKKLERNSVNQISESEYFFREDYSAIEEIFNWYATSNELNLQPGEGYFIAGSEIEMRNRIIYEIFPLIKEYIEEGLLNTAKEEFNNYFTSRVNKSLFA